MTPEIVVTLVLLGFVVFIFTFEIFRVDVAAILVMVLLGLLSLVPGLEGLSDGAHLFDGFSSNAVMSIIAVMIIGSGMDKTGVLNKVAAYIVRKGGRAEKKITAYVSAATGLASSVMQNVGAVALFIPVVSRVASRTDIPISRLLMPMAFCAIVGGTITMIGSSPLILLNDLLPAKLEKFHLFSVTPIGLTSLLAFIAYFYYAGDRVFPKKASQKTLSESDTAAYFKNVYGIDAETYEIKVPKTSPIATKTVGEVEAEYAIRVIAVKVRGESRVAPSREIAIEGGSIIAVLGSNEKVHQFVADNQLLLAPTLDVFSESLLRVKAGISEIVIPANSNLIGKTVSEIWMRKTYGLSVISIQRGRESFYKEVRGIPLQSGDTLVCHSDWQSLARIVGNRDFVVITTEFPHEQFRPNKVKYALFFLVFSLTLIMFTDIRLSVALMSGALGMVLSGVLTIDEAYKAVSWKTVFLLGSLIPLGVAVEHTGTAAWIALNLLEQLGDVPIWILQIAVALMTTFFSLTMSNVGATVLLVPIAVNIALTAGTDPRIFALIVALAASNAFILPTHQVNALVMGPGNYTVRDFIRSGSVVSVIYLFVMLLMVNIVF